jgi:uncharacterized protein
VSRSILWRTGKALCLHVSTTVTFGGVLLCLKGDFVRQRLNMDVDTAKKAIDFVVEKAGARRNIEVVFFGGETLLVRHRKKTVELQEA